MSRAVYPGSFDPISYGHINLAERGLKIFDQLIVAVARNVSKQTLFTHEEREAMAREVFEGVPGVTVAPPSLVDPYRTAPKPFDEMAQELNVGALLEGNVFRSGQRLRVTLQLTNPRSIGQFWTGSYDLDLSGDVLVAVDGVIPQIVESIRTQLFQPPSS